MKRLILLLALAACGGSDGTDPGAGPDADRVEIGPGVWEEGGQICAEYRPHLLSDPSVVETACVPADWPAEAFCWKTTDEPECYDGGGRDQAAGCIFIRDSTAVELDAGSQTVGCLLPGECIQDGIDNPPCCGDGGGLGAWDCE